MSQNNSTAAIRSICVFCGSQTGTHHDYSVQADRLGRELAKAGIRLVYGGGNIGLMGVVADAVLAEGGEVTGVIPQVLMERELAHVGVQDMRIVESMHVRKALMAELSDAFIALPGGLGTLEELCEILTWAQLGFHHKPVGLLNVNSFFQPLIDMLDRAVTDGFMRPQHRDWLFVADDISELMAHLRRIPAEPVSDAAALHKLT